MEQQFKYNVVTDEGVASSAYVFVGSQQYLATKDHPNFQRIIDALHSPDTTTDKIVGLFDVGVGIVTGFERLSERVSVSKGKLYLDGDPMNSALSDTILRFYNEGSDDLKPLVAFVEKIETNPNEHSREHLFRWLRDKNIGICPDGDFIAYKGLDRNEHSVHSGTAMVNGKVINGKIPNKPDTVIEMPRSKVTFDPANGCSTGLHAGNWSYAKGFAQGAVVIVKINPRDVVSVPTDSGDAKLRVCRYRVLKPAQIEDKSALFLTDPERTAKVWHKPEPTPEPENTLADRMKSDVPSDAPKPPKKAGASKPAKPEPVEDDFPAYYEEFTKQHWNDLVTSECRWVAKEWGIPNSAKLSVPALVEALTKEARARKRTW